ncbi:MAG: NAD-dependent succinate-semialdehyde dehydrogenase [Wenzhouxiangella sp.]|nr:MAG: NAD-dependent succinate-semialdehyde dehydrogenase [Wenzhouxiangella sp.]
MTQQPKLKVVNPATGQSVREIDTISDRQLEAALQAASDAAPDWAALGFGGRAKILEKVAAILRRDSERFEVLMREEMGKPAREAPGEVAKAAWCAEHYAAHAQAYLASDDIESDASRSFVQYRPLGAILGILPWNAPFWLAARFFAPTLMAGNTCLIKHDPHVPGCAAAIAEVFQEAGTPEGVFQNLALETGRVGRVIQDQRIQAVSFTGSDRAGGIVASTAAASIKHSVLELGGSDPAIVLADADLDEAADKLVLSRMINAGQSCIAAKRLIIEAPVYEEFLDKLRTRMEQLTVGDPASPETDIGPIARSDLRDNLHRQVRETIEAGARCLLGGELPPGDGFFYPVTLLADVTPGMCAASEETFGPVAVVMRAGNAEQAMAIANDTPWGLAASVWTGRPDAVDYASRFESGQVAINGLVKTDPRLPSGGIKRSGFGRELGRHGIHEFVNAQQVWIGPASG